MRSKVSTIGIVLAVVVSAIALRAVAHGQEPAREGVVDSLLLEVRALRGAIEQLVSASARVQLATGRLQIQEQRVNALSRQLYELRESLAAIERQTSDEKSKLADLEDALGTAADPGERRAINEQVTVLRRSLSAGTSHLERLRSEEAELTQALSAEQGRWTELNQQLDALDQALRLR